MTERLGPPAQPRAIVTWTLAADGIQFYLDGLSQRVYRGEVSVREVDVVSKAVVSGRPPGLPPAFRPVERLRLERLTLTRYEARRIHPVAVRVLRNVHTGFGRNALVTDGGAGYSGPDHSSGSAAEVPRATPARLGGLRGG